MVQVSLQIGTERIPTFAFVDSGATGNFMDSGFADHWGILTETLSQPLIINAVDGQPLAASPITRRTVSLEMTVGTCTEQLGFLITSVSSPPLILGYPWLTQHNPLISWTDGRIIQWGPLTKSYAARFSLEGSLLSTRSRTLISLSLS